MCNFAPQFQTGALVQLVRMPACHAGGRWFESCTHRCGERRRAKMCFGTIRSFFFCCHRQYQVLCGYFTPQCGAIYQQYLGLFALMISLNTACAHKVILILMCTSVGANNGFLFLVFSAEVFSFGFYHLG